MTPKEHARKMLVKRNHPVHSSLASAIADARAAKVQEPKEVPTETVETTEVPVTEEPKKVVGRKRVVDDSVD